MIPTIDWSGPVVPGQDAADSGACTVFAIAHWLQAVTGSRPTDAEIIAAYQAERAKRYPTGGGTRLTMPEGFFAAYSAGWLPAGTTIRRTYDVGSLAYGPLLAGYVVTDRWLRPDIGGCVASQGNPGGHHIVCILGKDADGYVRFANSWGTGWGDRGFGRILYAHDHLNSIVELWQVVTPGQPSSREEAVRAAAGQIPDTLRDQVLSVHINLRLLGYAGLPANPDIIMPDLIRRSMSRALTADQERAKSNLSAVYLLLVQAGIGADRINATWQTLQEANK